MEREALEQHPRAELAELTEIWRSRGLDPPLAAEVARQLTEADALAAHARDELGLTNHRDRAAGAGRADLGRRVLGRRPAPAHRLRGRAQSRAFGGRRGGRAPRPGPARHGRRGPWAARPASGQPSGLPSGVPSAMGLTMAIGELTGAVLG